jgi:hypothetical protein
MDPVLQPLPENMHPLATELRVYYRELPQLLAEGHDGKYFVAKGDASYGVWDTFHDAIQFGHDKFPDGKFLAQMIDRRFLAALAPFCGPHPEAEAEVA